MTETREYTTIDRSKWKSGEWDGEPDKIQWEDEATEMACLIFRHREWGHLCGYVGVAPDHPLHGKGYSEAEDSLGEGGVHGSLTYAAGCIEGPESETVCHVPGPGNPEHLWWFGFDCSHAWDKHPHGFPFEDEFAGASVCPTVKVTYKNVLFVKAECAELAKRLKEAESDSLPR
jgi:hypothetical protein